MYRTIVLTTDGSELARAAVPHVLHIAAASGARVTVLQVIDTVAQIITQTTPSGWGGGAGRYTVETAEEVVAAERSEADTNLEDLRRRLTEAGIPEVDTAVLEGHPGPAIVEAASAGAANLVVMATHGRSGVGRAVLGSVADYVVRHANCPVLLVRPPAD